MVDVTGGPDGVVADVVAGRGSVVVRAEDPDAVGVALADALDAELLDDVDALGTAVSERLAAIDARTRALAALEVHARLRAADGDRHVLTDTDGLRHLAERIRRSADLVDASQAMLRERLSLGTELAVHPDAIRKCAADLTEARAAVSAAEVEIAELEATLPSADDGGEPVPPPTLTEPAWDDDDRRTAWRAVLAIAVSLGVAVLVLVVVGSPVGFVLPAVALAWAVTVVLRHREDVAGRDVASDNLAAVSALTDQAYGGVALAEPEELVAARRRLAATEDRLRFARSAWEGLVGPGVDVDELDDVIAVRDPQWHVGDAELARTPTVRAADAHRRRLRAQWKLAWWALDRAVPAVGDAEAAIASLESEGVGSISVDTWALRSPERAEEESRFAELAGEQSVDDLRTMAGDEPSPLVVVDREGRVDAADLAARTAVLPADVRVVVVGPEPSGPDERSEE